MAPEQPRPARLPPPVTAGLGSVPVHHRRSQPEIYCQTHTLKNVPSDEFRQRIAKARTNPTGRDRLHLPRLSHGASDVTALARPGCPRASRCVAEMTDVCFSPSGGWGPFGSGRFWFTGGRPHAARREPARTRPRSGLSPGLTWDRTASRRPTSERHRRAAGALAGGF